MMQDAWGMAMMAVNITSKYSVQDSAKTIKFFSVRNNIIVHQLYNPQCIN